ncbi:MAG: gluconate 2-dehydrogenase subunit 3 family protein, partial [Akkermansiaceae bacterium]
MNSQDQENRLPRRRVLQWFAAVAAAEGMALPTAFAQNSKPASTGYGQDPVMAKSYERGELWPLMMTEAERSATIALADVIFPADDLGPAASEVRVADFIDEWISAPYVRQKGDRGVIIPGLKALNKECR